MKKDNSTIIMVLVILGVFQIIVGISYAIFQYARSGENINQVQTSTVTMDYVEGENKINITNAMPMADSAGKALTDSDQVFDFTVNITMSAQQDISYEVTAEKIVYPENGLGNDDVKLYLLKGTNGTIYPTEALQPAHFIPMGEDRDDFGASALEMRLDAGTVRRTTTYHYKLKMWVDENYQITNDVKYFTVKVNVYGKEGAITVD